MNVFKLELDVSDPSFVGAQVMEVSGSRGAVAAEQPQSRNHGSR